jgi:phosphoserine aminotransferase
MVPMNLLGEGRTADYVNSGSWAAKAIKEARILGNVHVAADTAKDMPARMPGESELDLTPDAAYVHITSNETIAGTQWKAFPRTDAPLVADMSSDILSRPFDASRFGLFYAGVQKNLGPAGVCVVVMRKDLAERAPADLPTMFRYATHIEKDSLYNTPPCFGIYVIMLVTRWLKNQGMEAVYRRNIDKAARVYAAIDGSDFFRGTAVPECRSDMNVTFRLPSEELETQFVKEAEAAGLKGLKGHRSVGGLRASIYNAFPLEGVDALASFMRDFEKRNG